MPARVDRSRSAESSSRIGFVLLMWTSTLRGRSSRASRSSIPPGPESGRWPMSPRGAPEMPSRASSSSGQNVPSTSTQIARREAAEHGVVQARDHRRVHRHAAPRTVAERERHGLQAGVRIAHEARRVAADRERLDGEARPVERDAAVRFERVPAHPAVAVEDPQDGVVVRERAPDRPVRQSAAARRHSRRISRPVVWSISASVSTTPANGVARTPSLPGGEQPRAAGGVRRRVDEEPRAVVARTAATTGSVGGRGAPRAHGPHVGQEQFHCG